MMQKFMFSFVLLALSAVCVRAEEPKPADGKPVDKLGYQNTPMQPNGKWHVHDGLRPQPKIVTPGAESTQEKAGTAPSDAVVLFDGTNLEKWRANNGEASAWIVENGVMSVPPKGTKNGGDIFTKAEFGDCQLHLEFSAPSVIKGKGQGRGNSGVFMFGRYEFQVLDCFDNPTYPDGTTGCVYGQYPPLVNACRKPGEWQTYDILFTAPKFKDGKLDKPAFVTILLNGVVVQNHTELLGGTAHQQSAKYTPHGEKGSIKLQDHGDAVRFRNIWIREIKGYDAE